MNKVAVQLVRARGLKDGSVFGAQDVYAVLTIRHRGRTVARIRSGIAKGGGKNPDWGTQARNRIASNLGVKLSDSIQPLDMTSILIEIKSVGVFHDDLLGTTGDVPLTSVWDGSEKQLPLIAGNVGIDADAVMTVVVRFEPKTGAGGSRAAAAPQPAVAVATVVEENPDEFIAHAQYSSEQTGVDSYVAQATASEVQKTNSAPSEPPTVHMTNL